MYRRCGVITILVLCYVFSCNQTKAQLLDEILSKHFDAIGQEQWSSIRSLEVVFERADIYGKTITIKQKKKSPNKIKREISLDTLTYCAVFDGYEFWGNGLFDTDSATNLSIQQRGILTLESAIGSPLILSSITGNQIEYMGTKAYGSKDYDIVRLILTSGFFTDFFIDKENYLIYKHVVYADTDGDSVDFEFYYANYRNLGGFTAPYLFEKRSKGYNTEYYNVKDILIGKGFSNTIFKKPE